MSAIVGLALSGTACFGAYLGSCLCSLVATERPCFTPWEA